MIRRPALAASLPLAEWDLVIRQARAGGLLGRLRYVLEEAGLLDAVPPLPRRHLDAAHTLALKHARDVRWEVECIREALAGTVDRVVLLKGAAYVLADLPPARGRMFNDIDVLVPKSKLPEVEDALQMGSWVFGKLDAYDVSYYRRWMHQIPPMVNVKRQTVIDVHHTLVPETAGVALDPGALFAATRPVPVQPGVDVLGPEEMVLHSAVHLFNEGEFERGLRDLDDLNSLLRHFGRDAGFWDRLLARAEALDLARPLFYLLRYAERVLGTSIPAPVVSVAARFGPRQPLLAIMDELFERALRSPHPSCRDALTGVALWLLYVRSHYLKMPIHIAVPHLLRKAVVRPAKA